MSRMFIVSEGLWSKVQASLRAVINHPESALIRTSARLTLEKMDGVEATVMEAVTIDSVHASNLDLPPYTKLYPLEQPPEEIPRPRETQPHAYVPATGEIERCAICGEPWRFSSLHTDRQPS